MCPPSFARFGAEVEDIVRDAGRSGGRARRGGACCRGSSKLLERLVEAIVVVRMEADGRLVQDVEDIR